MQNITFSYIIIPMSHSHGTQYNYTEIMPLSQWNTVEPHETAKLSIK